jgi:hypothetical protein
MNPNSTIVGDTDNLALGFLALTVGVIIICLNIACIMCCKPKEYTLLRKSDSGFFNEI